MDRRLESRLNPQAGKPALRSAHFRVCGFWGLSSPQFEKSVKMRPINAASFIWIHFRWLLFELEGSHLVVYDVGDRKDVYE